jgi:energy-coupling factor transporter ATP-binding protein EcfA2
MNLVPKLGEHMAIVGRNGSGKTTSAVQILTPLAKHHRVIIVDSKSEDALEAITPLIAESPHLALQYLKADEPLSFIYRPDGFYNEPEQLDWFLQQIYNSGKNGVTYVDEGYQVALNRMRPGRGYGNMLMRARYRKIANRIVRHSVISSTQRPVWVPKQIFTESSRFLTHGLNKDDLKVMAGYIGDDEILTNPPTYGDYDFWYHDIKRHHRRKLRFKLGES